MNDFPALSDAFAELERRADATPPTEPRPPRRSRAPLVAATVVAVAALATGAGLLSTRGDDHPRAGSPPSITSTAPVVPTTTAASTPSVRPHDETTVPKTVPELTDRLRQILGDTATFEVTFQQNDPVGVTLPSPSSTGPVAAPSMPAHSGPAADAGYDPYVKGTLTAGGVTGGFDLQTLPQTPGSDYSCEDPGESVCSIKHLSGGAVLMLSHEALPTGAPGCVTYAADIIYPQGYEIIMHLSDQTDPKGESERLGANPPLTLDQLGDIVTSPLW